MSTKTRQKVELLPGHATVLAERLFGQEVPAGLIVRENPRTITHRHTYGGLSPFFEELAWGKLMGTRRKAKGADIWLPPRVHCPDTWEEMEWVEIDTSEARVYTHSMTNLPGAGFMLTTPCPLITIEIPGVCTKFMSYLSEFGEGEPYIGMPVKPVFRTVDPTFTILDISWVPRAD
ncbi:hypothetical protein HYT05_02505 [Candidatus Kaiserbacteria bacterium]|nr:hypothetical protein [Candidatus Kaiserbacteria bacterium]